LTDWRRQRDAGAYEALKAVKRGPKVAEANPLAAEHADSDEAGHAFRNETGHAFRFQAGQCTDLMSATSAGFMQV
jgi:hypothetical protein